MSAESQSPSPSELPVRLLRPAELAASQQAGLSWLWRGFLAPHKVTALISPPKSGKTTLAAILLARFGPGGELAGLPVRPARVLVISEEHAADWDARCRRLGIGEHVRFLCRPFQGARPTEAQWFNLIAGVEALHRREAVDLVIIDALATLLPGYAETCAPKLLDCLLPLQALANLGPAVWLLHHPAKGKQTDAQSGRGTIALPGFADIVMEMSCYRRARSRDRRRRICSYSRYDETPRQLILELDAAGGDYLVRNDASGRPLVRTWTEVYDILAGTSQKLTQEEILLYWPSQESDPPDRSTLSRWLKRATEQGFVRSEGAGHRGSRYLYWLAGREPLLWPGDHASEEEQEAWRQRTRAYHQGLLKLPEAG
jgi:hypothetical protein